MLILMCAYKKKDGYYRKAKKEGYRSRAVYKLKQLDDAFGIFKKGYNVVDLGASPGGWSQYAVEVVGEGNVTAIDLLHMQEIPGVDFIRGDLTDQRTLSRLLSKTGKVDVVLSDMAPKFSGDHHLDQVRSAYLADCALGFCKKALKPGGKLVVKILQGEDFNDFLDRTKSCFHNVRCSSPEASRSSSTEMYVIASGFKSIHKS